MSANSIASGKKRTDIPANASPVYIDSGWVVRRAVVPQSPRHVFLGRA